MLWRLAWNGAGARTMPGVIIDQHFAERGRMGPPPRPGDGYREFRVLGAAPCTSWAAGVTRHELDAKIERAGWVEPASRCLNHRE